MRVTLHVMKAMLLYERGLPGDVTEALAELRAAEAAYERGGEVTALLWVRSWLGRVLHALGRRREAARLLDETRARAAAVGAKVYVDAVDRSRREDPVEQLGATPAEPHPAKRRAVTRACAIRAIHAAAAGDEGAARARIAEVERDATGPDGALDRAIAELASSMIARARGDAEEAVSLRARALATAAAGGVDADLLPRIEEALAPAAVVLDGRDHELRVNGEVISLKRRPILRKLLYTLARAPSATLGKEELVKRIWNVAYRPLVHDNALWVNIRRLRTTLEGSGVALEYDDDGYRLTVPSGFLFVDSDAPNR